MLRCAVLKDWALIYWPPLPSSSALQCSEIYSSGRQQECKLQIVRVFSEAHQITMADDEIKIIPHTDYLAWHCAICVLLLPPPLMLNYASPDSISLRFGLNASDNKCTAPRHCCSISVMISWSKSNGTSCLNCELNSSSFKPSPARLGIRSLEEWHSGAILIYFIQMEWQLASGRVANKQIFKRWIFMNGE